MPKLYATYAGSGEPHRDDALIAALGGAGRLLRLMRRAGSAPANSATVRKWRRRGIPGDYREAVAAIARERKVQIPEDYWL